MIFIQSKHIKACLFFALFIIPAFLFISLNGNSSKEKFSIVNNYPHDDNAFTQGLLFHKGFLYESTGLYGKSSLRKIEIETGRILQKKKIPDKYFGEGITILNNKIYQITWKSKTGFIYDLESFEIEGTFSYPTEGWGITHDRKNLIISDGSSNLYFLDPNSFKILNILSVTTADGLKVENLNELEYVNGRIYSNIWQTDNIAIINEETGKLENLIDLSKLKDQINSDKRIDVLNGIAYNPETSHFYFTGKLWPKLFEVKLNQ